MLKRGIDQPVVVTAIGIESLRKLEDYRTEVEEVIENRLEMAGIDVDSLTVDLCFRRSFDLEMS